jgi:hypothetical protein
LEKTWDVFYTIPTYNFPLVDYLSMFASDPLTSPRGRCLDHFVGLTRSLEGAKALFERLGFTVMPVMEHVELGTSNVVVQFDRTYLEIAGDLHLCRVPSLPTLLLPRLEAGEGLIFNSLTSNGLEADRDVVAATGIAIDPIISARRRVRLPAGGWDETDSRSAYPWNRNRVFMTMFLSDHRRPQAIFIPDYQTHPNRVTGVRGLICASARPCDDEAYLSKLLALAPSVSSERELRFDTPCGQSLEVLSPAALHERHGDALGSWLPDLQAHPLALRLSCEDLDWTGRLLSRSGIPTTRSTSGICVAPAHAAGIGLEFVCPT